MSKLRELLHQENINHPESWFDEVCNELFYKTVFHIKDRRYKITEAELYLNSEEHPDVFAHGSEEQKKTGLFYFHKRGGTYQEGNIKGVDITFGTENRFGGILLRGLQNLEDEADYIDGPGRLSQRIVDTYGGVKVIDVAPDLNIDIFDSTDLWLEEIEGEEKIIYKAPRHGLTLTKEVEGRMPYFAKHYRYLAAPLKTDIGKVALTAALKVQGLDPVELLGVREKTLESRMEIFNKGIDIHPEGTYKEKSEKFLLQVYGELRGRYE